MQAFREANEEKLEALNQLLREGKVGPHKVLPFASLPFASSAHANRPPFSSTKSSTSCGPPLLLTTL